jgi:branched-chain amino acid transport system ATP-binding protein
MTLRLENLTKRFGGLTAVDSVSCDVADHGVTAIIGPNGAGKTTLFNMISGFHVPTSGRVTFDGRDITGARPEDVAALGIIRTFQLVQLFSDLPAIENVKVGRHLQTKGGFFSAIVRPRWVRDQEAALDESARHLLERVGLGAQADDQASALPYGQQRLLEIARGLAAEPRLLLLDEPAAGLNSEESKRLSGLIRKIAEGGTRVLLIEHDMNLVMNTADFVIVLDFGKKIAQGTPAEIRTNPAVLAAYLGETAHD